MLTSRCVRIEPSASYVMLREVLGLLQRGVKQEVSSLANAMRPSILIAFIQETVLWNNLDYSFTQLKFFQASFPLTAVQPFPLMTLSLNSPV